MTRFFAYLLFFTSLFSAIEAFAESQAVVLIPGTLNSVAPGSYKWDSARWILEVSPYFSQDISEAFKKQGFDVYVVKNLHPTGDLLANGESAAQQIRIWYSEKYGRQKKPPITLVAHSAGGFYALEAATQLVDLPIRQVICLSTPLKGMELARFFFEPEGRWARFWSWVLHPFQKMFDYRGLTSVTPVRVKDFLSQVRLSRETEVWGIAGQQDPPHHWREVNDPHRLSPLFALAQRWIQKPSDGMVTVESALGQGVELARTQGQPISVHSMPEVVLNLDHAKQVFDYRIFKIMGIRESEWIQAEQQRFYGELATMIKQKLKSSPKKQADHH